MALFQRYNNENILTRAIIAGLLDILNNHIKYNQIWGNDPVNDFESISVPWFYDQSGDERFMQDFYTHYAECMPPRPVDGNFDVIPRGIITYKGSAIDAQRITSRYVQGNYVKEIDGKLEGFVSYLYSIPLNVNFDLELTADTQLTALKIEQEIRETFYKTVTYYVYYKGMRIGCTAGFPDQVGIEKKIEYKFEESNKIKLTFQLEIETYQPVFDPTTEMPARNNIKKFAYRLYDKKSKSDGYIHDVTIKSPKSLTQIPKGTPMWVEWIFNREGGIMRNIDLYWTLKGDNIYNEISIAEANHEYFIWNIPSDFTKYKEPDILWDESNNVSVSRKPTIKIIPDLNTNQITAASFKALSDGYFIASSDDASICIQLEMKDDNGKIYYTPDGAIYANIKFNKLNMMNPVTVIDPSLFFPGTIDYKEIDIYVANSVNKDVWGVVTDLTIV